MGTQILLAFLAAVDHQWHLRRSLGHCTGTNSMEQQQAGRGDRILCFKHYIITYFFLVQDAPLFSSFPMCLKMSKKSTLPTFRFPGRFQIFQSVKPILDSQWPHMTCQQVWSDVSCCKLVAICVQLKIPKWPKWSMFLPVWVANGKCSMFELKYGFVYPFFPVFSLITHNSSNSNNHFISMYILSITIL